VVEPIAAMLGADRVIATRMEIVDGRYSGEIEY
jgi:phosphoserine phosphatase